MEYYLVIKRYELVIHITTWVNLRRMTLSDENGNPKTLYSVQFQLHNDKIMEVENRLVGVEVKGVWP